MLLNIKIMYVMMVKQKLFFLIRTTMARVHKKQLLFYNSKLL